MDGPTRALKARWVFPVDGPPIEDGAVTCCGETITAVGRDPTADIIEDLGNVALLPGLVNPHTHLEFSDLDKPLGKPGTSLPDWIRDVIEYRTATNRDISAAVKAGLAECVSLGTTAIGEIVSDAVPLHSYAAASIPLTLFHEMIGLTPERGEEILQSAAKRCNATEDLPNCTTGRSPHAPYSVHRDVVAACAVDRKRPVAMHLAESPEELELLASGSGPFVELLKDLNAWDGTAIAKGTRPLDYLKLLAACDRSLVIHGNFLDDEEIQFLAANRSRMTVVYCPRTHAYFGHPPYPLAKMLAAGVRVALGTDSRASNPNLSVFEEMRFVARSEMGVSPQEILEMGTISGAVALNDNAQIGCLAPRRDATLTAVSLPDDLTSGCFGNVLESTTFLVGSWVRGIRQI